MQPAESEQPLVYGEIRIRSFLSRNDESSPLIVTLAAVTLTGSSPE